MRETSREWSPVPYEEERDLRKRRQEAIRAGNREEERKWRNELVNLYVYYGEYFKLSETPDYTSAQRCLEKALELKPDHPVANYRYGHLLFRKREYEKAAWHFRRALDGSRETGLNDSQTLVAQMVLVNCGFHIAKDALREVRYLQDNEFLEFDWDLVERYNEQMLIQSEELLQQHLYCMRTPEGTRHISRDEFLAYPWKAQDNEVLLIVDEGHSVRFRDVAEPLSQHAFYVFWALIRSDDFVRAKDIAAVLGEGGAELELRYDHIRQLIVRLSRRIPFWDQVIGTKEETKQRSLRRRRDGITYTVLCHASVVLP